eukprot:gene10226-7167_t
MHLNRSAGPKLPDTATSTSSSSELSEEVNKLPEHIRLVTDPRKLHAQLPYFVCPQWAGLPATSYHLFCTREAVPFPALDLSRLPYYLFGKSAVADYVLEHHSISAVHAVLVFHCEQDCFVLLDLRSTNGVKVNGRRIERERPVPLQVGSVIQFGYSTRHYELRRGAAPSSKRLRDMREEAEAEAARAHREGPRQQRGEEAEDEVEALLAELEGEAGAQKETTATAAVAPQEDETFHLYQLVIKHKDLKNPVSRGARKGERITRSREDAVELANFILDAHKRQQEDAAKVRGFVPWTVEEFVAAVEAYNEVFTKTNGDLGLVARGTYTTAGFDDAAFALRRHEVSAPLETPLGVHLLYRSD